MFVRNSLLSSVGKPSIGICSTLAYIFPSSIQSFLNIIELGAITSLIDNPIALTFSISNDVTSSIFPLSASTFVFTKNCESTPMLYMSYIDSSRSSIFNGVADDKMPFRSAFNLSSRRLSNTSTAFLRLSV